MKESCLSVPGHAYGVSDQGRVRRVLAQPCGVSKAMVSRMINNKVWVPGPCAKRVVKCVIRTIDGKMSAEGSNWCANPQTLCPRGPGEGYEKCKSICRQGDHAEIDALRNLVASGGNARGATASVYGHYHVCQDCAKVLTAAGVAKIIIHTEL
jgi:deoxycytidylate deaminase